MIWAILPFTCAIRSILFYERGPFGEGPEFGCEIRTFNGILYAFYKLLKSEMSFAPKHLSHNPFKHLYFRVIVLNSMLCDFILD